MKMLKEIIKYMPRSLVYAGIGVTIGITGAGAISGWQKYIAVQDRNESIAGIMNTLDEDARREIINNHGVWGAEAEVGISHVNTQGTLESYCGESGESPECSAFGSAIAKYEAFGFVDDFKLKALWGGIGLGLGGLAIGAFHVREREQAQLGSVPG